MKLFIAEINIIATMKVISMFFMLLINVSELSRDSNLEEIE